MNVDYTLLPSEQAFVPHLSCKGVFVVVSVFLVVPDSVPDDRDDVAAVSLDIGVTSSSLELSCQRRTRRRRLLKAAKEKRVRPRFHNLVSEPEGTWKSRDKERGRDEPEE